MAFRNVALAVSAPGPKPATYLFTCKVEFGRPKLGPARQRLPCEALAGLLCFGLERLVS